MEVSLLPSLSWVNMAKSIRCCLSALSTSVP